eukprot:gene2819-1804_t
MNYLIQPSKTAATKLTQQSATLMENNQLTGSVNHALRCCTDDKANRCPTGHQIYTTLQSHNKLNSKYNHMQTLIIASKIIYPQINNM